MSRGRSRSLDYSLPVNAAEFARRIDHTALRPETTLADVERLCDEAHALGCAAACVAPVWVEAAARRLSGSGVAVASVVGFPHGTETAAEKAGATRRALDAGASEIDMVMAIGLFRGGDVGAVEREIAGVVEAARGRNRAVVKVILETALLDDRGKVEACRIVEAAGADFVKTSTGFGPGGATVADVELLVRTVGGRLGVKASGGIRTLDFALALFSAGAARLGCSATPALIAELRTRGK